MDNIILKKIEEAKQKLNTNDLDKKELIKIYQCIKLDEDRIKTEEVKLKLYNLMAYICIKLEIKEEEINYLFKIKKIKSDFDILIRIVDYYYFIDKEKCLLECSKILQCSELIEDDEKKERVINKKLDVLKDLMEIDISKNKKELYNREIINCYDNLIELHKNKKENIYEFYIEEKINYLMFEPRESVDIKNENIKRMLIYIETDMGKEWGELYYQKKIYGLLCLNKYEEIIYLYKVEVENNYNDNICFIHYLTSLYRLGKIDEFREEIRNKEIFNDSESIGILLYKLKIAIRDNDEELINDVLIKSYQLNNNYAEDLRFKALIALYKISKFTNEEYKKKIEEMYFKTLINDKTNNNNYQAYSNITLNLFEKNDKNSMLYHYTSIYALKGIIENKELWVTGMDYLNDSKERRYIIEYLEFVIKKLKESSNIELIQCLEYVLWGIRLFFKEKLSETGEIYDVIRSYVNNNLIRRLNDSYVLSLSKNSDSLTLWGNYANNEGYNIGFDKNSLIETFINSDCTQYSMPLHGEVLYKSIEYDKDVNSDEIIIEIEEYYNKCIEYDVSKEKIICGLIGNMIYIGLFIKQKEFMNEEEYRVVFLRENYFQEGFKTEFRIKDSSFIPFIKVPFNERDIKSIRVGPNNKNDITKNGLKCLLEEMGFDLKEIEINKSNIPLRY